MTILSSGMCRAICPLCIACFFVSLCDNAQAANSLAYAISAARKASTMQRATSKAGQECDPQPCEIGVIETGHSNVTPNIVTDVTWLPATEASPTQLTSCSSEPCEVETVPCDGDRDCEEVKRVGAISNEVHVGALVLQDGAADSASGWPGRPLAISDDFPILPQMKPVVNNNVTVDVAKDMNIDEVDRKYDTILWATKLLGETLSETERFKIGLPPVERPMNQAERQGVVEIATKKLAQQRKKAAISYVKYLKKNASQSS